MALVQLVRYLAQDASSVGNRGTSGTSGGSGPDDGDDDGSSSDEAKGDDMTALIRSIAALTKSMARERRAKPDADILTSWLKANTTSVQITQFTEFFDGNPEKFAQWFTSFGLFKRTRGFSNDDAFEAITTRLLVGKAKSDYIAAADVIRTFTSLKLWLIKEYATEEMIAARKRLLSEFAAKVGETPKEALKRFLRLKAAHEAEVDFIVEHRVLEDSILTRKLPDDILTEILLMALTMAYVRKHGRCMAKCLKHWQNSSNESKILLNWM